MAGPYSFGPFVAYNATTGALAAQGSTGSVYAIADTSYATPLTVVHDGASKTSVPVEASGLVKAFTQASNEELWWKSGTGPAIRITSPTEAVTALNPGEPGTTVQAVIWNGSAYPTQPATLPGVVLRIAVGPSAPTYATISGVADAFAYKP